MRTDQMLLQDILDAIDETILCTPVRVRSSMLTNFYGLTFSDKSRLSEKPHGVCPIQ